MESHVEFVEMLRDHMEAAGIASATDLQAALARSGSQVHYNSVLAWMSGRYTPNSVTLHALMDVLKLKLRDRETMAYYASLPKRAVPQGDQRAGGERVA
jgi:hypothetical protein